MAGKHYEEAKSAADELEAQQNATEGLKQLVVAVRNYIIRCVELLGSGYPTETPDFSDLITEGGNGKNYKSPTDTSDKSEPATAYDQNVDRVEEVNKRLTGNDSHVGSWVSAVADTTESTCKRIESEITTLRKA